MRIGIFLGNTKPYEGGGYTVEQTILDDLENNDFDNEYYIFYYGINNLKDRKNLKFISLEQKNIFKVIISKIKKILFLNNKSILIKKIDYYKIELFWFITPYFEFVDIPYIYTVWDLQHRLQPYFPEVSITGSNWEKREKRYSVAITRASFVIVGSEIGRQEVINFYSIPKERVRVISLPTPTYVFKMEKNKPRDFIFAKNTNYLFYPAQFWPHKNHICIILALKILNEKYKLNLNIIFTGIDKGNLEYIKEKSIELNVYNNVNFLGFVSQNELIFLYKNAFALVFPSFFGPDNIPLLEAFALGCPVVTSNIKGVKEQLNEAVLLFDPSNENDLADKIKFLFENLDFREKLILEGKKYSRNHNSINYVESIKKIINEFKPIRRCWSIKKRYIHL